MQWGFWPWIAVRIAYSIAYIVIASGVGVSGDGCMCPSDLCRVVSAGIVDWTGKSVSGFGIGVPPGRVWRIGKYADGLVRRRSVSWEDRMVSFIPRVLIE